MSFVAFNCPDCNQRIEAPPETVDYDFQCPTCETTFVPSEASDLEYVSSRKPAKRSFVKGNAIMLSRVSLGAFALAGVGVLVGVIEAVANKIPVAMNCYYVAGGFFTLAFWLCLLAQLLHIRAELEDLNND